VGRKRGSKPSADEQEPDRRQCRSGRAGNEPHSFRGQGSAAVDPVVVPRRVVWQGYGLMAVPYADWGRLFPQRLPPHDGRLLRERSGILGGGERAVCASSSRVQGKSGRSYSGVCATPQAPSYSGIARSFLTALKDATSRPNTGRPNEKKLLRLGSGE